MRIFAIALGLLTACGQGAVGPLADFQWIANAHDGVERTADGADLRLSPYGSVWFTLRRDQVPPGTWASIRATFRTDCAGLPGALWAGVDPQGQVDKRTRLDGVSLRAASYVPPTFYFEVVAMNSSPVPCRVQIGDVAFSEGRK